jgi:mannose-6-phosphate isomerase-like protein (cupin superfamily)
MNPGNENDIIYEKVSSYYERRIVHLNDLMVVICDFSNGPMKNPDPPHSHPHEQITYVAEGELNFFKGDRKFHLIKGDIITVPSGIPHCIQTISSFVRLSDSFSPIRKEFLKQV